MLTQAEYRPVAGKFLQKNATFVGSNQQKTIISFEGYNAVHNQDNTLQRARINFDESALSKHLLLLGGIGTGKTNAFNQIIFQMRKKLSENDVMVIFDTKGDFYKEFYRSGDIVISAGDTATGASGKDYWNLFNEVTIDGEAKVRENIMEVAKSLFYEKIEKSQQPFFPNAAKDIFAGVVEHFLLSSTCTNKRSNQRLIHFFNSKPIKEFQTILSKHDSTKSMVNYISNDTSNQTQGVISELQQLVREIFVGNFAQTGTLSIRNLIRQKGGRTIFIEYDMSRGNLLTPIYRLIIDLAIKEALSREKEDGNVYFMLDEFKLLPYLQHIDDGVNFGRSLGAKFFIGVQNIEQIFDSYGEYRARSILSGFTTTISFRVNDYTTRDYIKQTLGRNKKYEKFHSEIATRGIYEQVIDGFVVEDWDIDALGIGWAIIKLSDYPYPILFKFDRYMPKYS